MTKIFLVQASAGEYDSYTIWPIKAFYTESKANKFIKLILEASAEYDRIQVESQAMYDEIDFSLSDEEIDAQYERIADWQEEQASLVEEKYGEASQGVVNNAFAEEVDIE